MGTRVGIELSPVACRLVELEGPSVNRGQAPETRVRSYAVLPPWGPETARRLAELGKRPAAVVVWGVRNDHRQVVVANGSYEKMRTEALAAARSAGVDIRGAIADVATASNAIKGAKRQPVVLALASADDVSAAVQPLRDAGVRIQSVITPADALLGLARSRQAFAVPGGIEAYVALDETATCVALVRDGSLLSARELPWGYLDGTGASSADVERRDDLAARLVDELAEFLTTVGAYDSAVAQVSICGGLPELRTMTIPLMERLDVEVEALDSLFGIDVAHLPEPAHEFREQASTLRLAWAAAADWHGPINLMRHRRRRNRRVAVARAAIVAGVAAGLGAGWAIQQSAWWQTPTPQPVARSIPPPAPVTSPAPARGTPTPRPAPPNVAAPPAPAPVPPTPTPSVARGTPPAPTPSVARGTPPAAPPPVARVTPPASTPPVARGTPPAATPPAARVTPPAATPPVARVTPPAPTPPVARATPPPPTPSVARGTPPAPTPSVARGAPPAPTPPVARGTPPAAPPPVARVTPPASTPPVARGTPPAATPPVARVTPPAATPPVARGTPPAAPPPVARGTTSAPTPPGARVTPPAPTPPVARGTPPAATPPIARGTPAAATPPVVRVTPPAATPPLARVTPPAPTPPAARGAPPLAAAPVLPARQPAPATRPPARRAEEIPVPFDAVLGTILYSPDRRLAIVNGRIVGPGDTVNGGRIVDITPGTVLLRDAQGRLRSLTLGAVGGSGTAP